MPELDSGQMWRCGLIDYLNPQREVQRLLVLNASCGVSFAHAVGPSTRPRRSSISGCSKQVHVARRLCYPLRAFDQHTAALSLDDAKTELPEPSDILTSVKSARACSIALIPSYAQSMYQAKIIAARLSFSSSLSGRTFTNFWLRP